MIRNALDNAEPQDMRGQPGRLCDALFKATPTVPQSCGPLLLIAVARLSKTPIMDDQGFQGSVSPR